MTWCDKSEKLKGSVKYYDIVYSSIKKDTQNKKIIIELNQKTADGRKPEKPLHLSYGEEKLATESQADSFLKTLKEKAQNYNCSGKSWEFLKKGAKQIRKNKRKFLLSAKHIFWCDQLIPLGFIPYGYIKEIILRQRKL